MKKMQKSFFAVTALILCAGNAVAASSSSFSSGSTPLLVPRSTHKNVARDIVGWEEYINLCDKDCLSGAMALTVEFDQTFRSRRLAERLFGADISRTTTAATAASVTAGCNSNGCGSNSGCDSATLAISGSQVATRGANDWLADYFGLPTDFSSTISVSPRIRNITTDIAFYFGLDEWCTGSYFRLDLPITYSRWALRYNENVIDAGVADYAEGYFSPGIVDRADLVADATSFLTGASVPALGDGVIFNNLSAAKWSDPDCNCKGLSKTRLAALTAELGWNFVCCDDYHFGLNLYAAAPTGNRPTGEFFFEPIVGNGHHWELGAGVSAHAVLWRGCESDATFNVYLEGNVEHLFKACQTRVFDLCGKPSSRYALAQRLTDNTQDLAGFATAGVPASSSLSPFQFADEFSPVANLTSSRVDVKVAVQGDVAVKLAYGNGCGFTWDLGYEFWGRSCEKIRRRSGCNSVDPLSTASGQTWALKGDAYVYGFCPSTDATPIALAATQSEATIHGGTNLPLVNTDDGTNTAYNRNPGIDGAQFASATCPISGAATPVLFDSASLVTDAATNQTRTSIDPIVLSDADIDLSGTKGMSNKIFTHLSYAWLDCEDWTPFLGIGASAEFASNNCGDCSGSNDCSTTSCGTTSTSCSSSSDTGSCRDVAISQWGVWVKGGFTFN